MLLKMKYLIVSSPSPFPPLKQQCLGSQLCQKQFCTKVGNGWHFTWGICCKNANPWSNWSLFLFCDSLCTAGSLHQGSLIETLHNFSGWILLIPPPPASRSPLLTPLRGPQHWLQESPDKGGPCALRDGSCFITRAILSTGWALSTQPHCLELLGPESVGQFVTVWQTWARMLMMIPTKPGEGWGCITGQSLRAEWLSLWIISSLKALPGHDIKEGIWFLFKADSYEESKLTGKTEEAPEASKGEWSPPISLGNCWNGEDEPRSLVKVQVSRLQTNGKGLWGSDAGLGVGEQEDGMESGPEGRKGVTELHHSPEFRKDVLGLSHTLPPRNLPSTPAQPHAHWCWVIKPVPSEPRFPKWSFSRNYRDAGDGSDYAGEPQDPHSNSPPITQPTRLLLQLFNMFEFQ